MNTGDRVTLSARPDWLGTIERIDKVDRFYDDGNRPEPTPRYWVRWEQRERHDDRSVRKTPTIGHWREELISLGGFDSVTKSETSF